MQTFTRTFRFAAVLLFAAVCSAALSAAPLQEELSHSRKLRNIGRLYMACGQYDKAEIYIQQALGKLAPLQQADSEKAICLIDLATLYYYQERLAESEELFLRGLAAQQNALGADHPYAAHTLRNLTAVYIRQGRLDRAAETLEWAFDIILKHHLPDNRILTPFYIDQAILLTKLGSYDYAEVLFTEMLQRITSEFGPNHPYLLQARQGLTELYLETEQYAQAADEFQKLMSVQQAIYGQNSQMLVGSYLLGARICRRQGDLQQMQDYFDKALAAVANSGNLIAVARLYEQMETIRSADIIAAVHSSQPEDSAG
jgi:tetratricopeptide (TPR) repeat protein